MASPFRIFRKHQKAMIVSLVLMAMFSFILVPSIMQMTGSGARTQNPVVVKTSEYGDINERRLQLLRSQRQQVRNFLQRVQQAVVDAKRQANLQASQEKQVALRADVAQQVRVTIGTATEEEVVDTWLYAQHAEELGLIVSNKAINDFLREVAEYRLSSEQRKKIIAEVNSTPLEFFEVLRHELLALRVRMMFNVSSAGTTPAQRWEYYTRLKRLATIEAIPAPVADYVDKVKDPPRNVLQKFFEDHKDDYPNPYSPEPGFRTPHKIAVRYFKADIEKFMAAMTEDEVKEFYQENKEYYDDRFAPPPTEKPAAEEKGAAKEESGKEPPTEEPPAEKGPEAVKEKESAEEPTAAKEGEIEEDKGPAGEPETEDKKENGKGEQSPDEAPAEGADKTDGPAVEPKSGETSSAKVASPFSLTGFLQEETGEPDPAPAETPAKEPQEPTSEPEPPASAPAIDPKMPTGESESDDAAKPAGKTAEAVEKPADGSSETTPEAPQKDAADEKKAPEDPLAGPLGEMVRRQLAIQKTEEIFGRLKGVMNRYRNDSVRYEVAVERGVSAKKPEEPDFEALAKEADPTGEEGLVTGETSLMSQWDFEDEPSGIGRSSVSGRMAYSTIPFVAYAFREKFDLYVAAQSRDIGEDHFSRYLFWKVKDGKERVPKFEDQGVRELVLRAWKMVEARKLATKAAEDLGNEARKAGMSLSQTFIERPDIPVTSTSPFSWLTHGNVPLGMSRTPPRLSEVTGVETAGTDFMRTVFDLEKGQIGVAMNHPKTIAYVVRLSDISPPQDVLWVQFEVETYSTYMDVAGDDRVQMLLAWQDELRKAAGLEWVRLPYPGQSE